MVKTDSIQDPVQSGKRDLRIEMNLILNIASTVGTYSLGVWGGGSWSMENYEEERNRSDAGFGLNSPDRILAEGRRG